MKSSISLKDYLSDLTEIINEYSRTGLIASSEIYQRLQKSENRFGQRRNYFFDESALFFKEYLDLRYRIDKKSYSFHYQDLNAKLLFRYDNALHKPTLKFNEHKHIRDQIIFADIPNMADIFEEIANNYLNVQLSKVGTLFCLLFMFIMPNINLQIHILMGMKSLPIPRKLC